MQEPRLATIQDLASIEECARRAYAKYVERIGREPAPMVADFATLIETGKVYVIAEDSRLCGYVVFYPVDGKMMLENVAVFPDLQGCGHGLTLIRLVEQSARRAGLKAVSLYTNVHMRENVSFYEALGFTETDRRTEQGFERIFFEKSLA